jgi:outer membrane lipoprotein SlyB
MKKQTIEHLSEKPIEVGVFDTVEAAGNAVDGLLAAGFTVDQITVVCSDETKEQFFRAFEHQQPAGSHDARATVTGGAVGALLAGLSIVATAAVTGGVAILAAGPISAVAGGVAGGFVGAMMTRGVEKSLADFYQQAVVDGRILVAAEDTGPNGEQSLAAAASVLTSAGAKALALPEG